MRLPAVLTLLLLSLSAHAQPALVGDVRFPDRSGGLRDSGPFRGKVAVAVIVEDVEVVVAATIHRRSFSRVV